MDVAAVTEAIRSVYPKISAVKLGQLLDALDPFMPDGIGEVSMPDARVPVERVEAYGLEIGLDALGRASAVYFPEGAEIVEAY